MRKFLAVKFLACNLVSPGKEFLGMGNALGNGDGMGKPVRFFYGSQ